MYLVGVLSNVYLNVKTREYIVDSEAEACGLASRYVSPTTISVISNKNRHISAVYFTENFKELVESVLQSCFKYN